MKYLGLYFNDKLNLAKHIELSRKTTTSHCALLYNLRQLRPYMKTTTAIILTNYLMSHLQYCN